jgi:hypothetical protein
MVFKVITRIILILLAACLVSGGLYLAFNNNASIGLAAEGFGNRGGRNFSGNGLGLPNLGLSQPQDFGRGSRENGISSTFPLSSIFRMLALVAATTLVVAVVEKLGGFIFHRPTSDRDASDQ